MKLRILLALKVARWVLEVLRLAVIATQGGIDVLVEWLEGPGEDRR